MAADTRNIFFSLIILFVIVPPCDLFSIGDVSRTLHFPKLSDAERFGKNIYHITVDTNKFVDGVEKYLSRRIRDTSSQNPSASSSVAKLNNSMSTLIVHWAMNDSDVIIALAKETFTIRPAASSLYISRDYGKTFQDVSNKLMVDSVHTAIIDSYKNSPLFNSHYIFSDIKNNCTFQTHNFGETFRRTCGLSFRPKIIQVHPTVVSSLLAFDDKDPQKRLFYSIDFGFSWHLLQNNVKFFFWGVAPYDKNNMTVYVEEERKDDNIVIKQEYRQDINSNNNWHRSVVLEGVEDFEVRGPYLFATKKVRLLGSHDANTLQLWVSYKRGEFQAAQFPYSHKNLDFYIADASEGQVMACVSHNNSLTNLYISEVEGLKFSLSLERIVYYNPKGANKDTWIRQYTNDTFADIYKVNGMRGIYIASQIKNTDISEQVTLISYDKGGEWELLTSPDYKPDGSSTNCSKSNRCSLHLSQQYHQLYYRSGTSPITTHKSAPGLILAAGVTGSSLKGSSSIYVSSNAGVSWHQVLEGVYMYTFGDHGGILVALQQYSVTNQIFYSTNEGETWQPYKFMKDDTKIRIYGLLTEPGETTTIFSVYGSYVEKHSWLIVQVDLRSVFTVNCTKDDYKIWSLPMSTPDHGCLLGKKVEFERRIAHAPCFNGKNYVRQRTERNCSCTRDDFECDYGFKDMSSMCKTDPEVPADQIHKIPQNCPVGTVYPYTRGYRKVAGDTCEGGDEHKFAPLTYSCPIIERREFLLYTTRRTIARIDLDNNNNEILVNTGLQDVPVVDFDYHDNCVFWADVAEKKIKKLCLGENEARNITDIIDTNIRSVEGLAYDWTAKTIYWVDGLAKRINVASKEGKWRRQLINSTHLDRPHSIALNPHYGSMYWSDWSDDNPRISCSWMDGTVSSIKTIVSGRQLQWPDGLTVDIELERIFWTDSGKNVIMSANLNGNDRKVLIHGAANLLHPYSVGVYKNDMYWSDWGKDAIFVANKESGLGVQTVKSKLVGVTDIKIVSHTSQQVNGACSPGHLRCSQLCLPRPHPTVKGTQNRTCKCGDDFQRTINAATGDENCRCGPGETMLNGICEMSTNSSTCSSDRFHCASGECMPLTWECDHDNDCSDGSDELNCPYSTCDADQFTCKTGRCLPKKWHCDFDNDCGDGSDEQNCEYPTCDPNQFQCDNKRCIAAAWKCDFDDDCQDNSDERACNYTSTCRSWEFSCNNSSQCIGTNRQCDGHIDCDDGTDEENCETYSCSPWKFKCLNDTQCIFRTWRCDGDEDCKDGSDEVGCTTSSTPSSTTFSPEVCGQYTCGNKFCLEWRYICNGINDCGDNSDEEDCGIIDTSTTTTSSPVTCSANDYRCNNGRCVHNSQKCNGVNECGDNSDETPCDDGLACLPNQFHCYNASSDNRQCIWDAWVCDNDNDCHNGEDEKNCTNMCKSSDDFKCRYSEGCIRNDQVCDKIKQCSDGSDESHCTDSNSTQPSIHCNTRYTFKCIDECKVWAYLCDGNIDCMDASDEDTHRCGDRNKKIESLRITQITSTTVHFGISSRTYGQHQSYKISYGKENDVTSWINDTISHTTHRILNLQPSTQYQLTVYIKINNVLYNPIPPTVFKTEEGVPSAPINVIYAIDTDDTGTTSVSVRWDRPKHPNGDIRSYNIYYKNIQSGVERKKTINSGTRLEYYLDNNDLTENDVYNFTIAAVTEAGEGNRTTPVKVVFKQPSTDITMKIIKKEVTNTSATISWTTVKAAVKYVLYVSLRNTDQANDEDSLYNTTEGTFTIHHLCPGNDYDIKIQPISKQGPLKLIEDRFSTKGMKLGAPSIMSVSETGSNDVIVNIIPPSGSHHKQKLKYVIYYGKDKNRENDKKIFTTNHQKIISDLTSCTRYYFYVGIAGSSCPVSSVYTYEIQEDDKLRPRNLHGEFVSLTSLNLIWDSPCTREAVPLSYVVSKKILGKPANTIMTGKSSNTTLYHVFKSLKRGVTYVFRVRTSEPGSRLSTPFTVNIRSYLAVENLDVIEGEQDQFFISWRYNSEELVKPNSAIKYEVRITRKQDSYNKTLYTNTTIIPVKFELGYVYIINVRYKINGNYSETSVKSFPYEVEVLGPKDSVTISNTNLVAIVVPVCAVILVLVVVVIALGIRHKRLQRSFTAFANSHYDTRSGTTTFSSEDLGDEDTPMIQGFSDDEPLVLA